MLVPHVDVLIPFTRMTNSVFLTPLIEDFLEEGVDAKRIRLSLAELNVVGSYFRTSPRSGKRAWYLEWS